MVLMEEIIPIEPCEILASKQLCEGRPTSGKLETMDYKGGEQVGWLRLHD